LRGSLETLDHRVLEDRGLIEIATDDVGTVLQRLGHEVVGFDRLCVRQPNLEDLFLDLTGHSLRA
ncbi:MAG: ABC transporter ATP-binding protein, partial [Woeseiaceae bacterium]